MGGFGGVGAIGGELLGGEVARIVWHGLSFRFESGTGWGWSLKFGWRQMMGRKGVYGQKLAVIRSGGIAAGWA
jgi:hypothetical protein